MLIAVLGLACFALLLFPGSDFLKAIATYSFLTLIAPFLGMLILAFMDDTILQDPTIWKIFFGLPFVMLAKLLQNPKLASPKNITKELLQIRKLQKDTRIIGYITLALMFILIVSGLLNPFSFNLSLWTTVIIFVWIGGCSISGCIFLPFVCVLQLIINWTLLRLHEAAQLETVPVNDNKKEGTL